MPLCTVRVRFVEWDKLPLVPCAETVKFPVAALEAAPNRTEVLAPAATVKGLVGLDVTPEGSAPKVTCTLPVKPFSGLTEILTAELAAPWITEIELGDKAMEKSGEGGGGGG
jgi:hypothetical protein